MRNRIRELRKAKGITMKQLGAVLGLAESTISQYETGKRDPDFDTISKIADYFGVSLEYLLNLDSDNEKPSIQAVDLFEGIGGKDPLGNLSKVDLSFYSDYAALSEADKETIRMMVNIMRGLRKNENPPQE